MLRRRLVFLCIMVWYSHSFVRYSLVGICLGAGFVVPSLWWLSIVGICLQLHLLAVASARQWVWVWYAWGIKYLLALYWFWSVYPIDWLGDISAPYQVAAIMFYWLTAAVWLGSGAYGFVIVYQKILSQNRCAAYVAIPFVWLMAELFGALIFSIATYGPGASVGSQFSFGFVGYHLAQHGWLLQFAHVAGVYGLTVLMVSMAVLMMVVWQSKKYTSLCVAGVCLLGSGWVPVISQEHSTEASHTIAVVDTNIPIDFRLTEEREHKKTEQQQAAYTAAQELDTDYIIFPEDSRLFNHAVGTTTLAALLSFQSSVDDAIVVDSSRVQIDAYSAVLQSIVFDPANKQLTAVTKSYLVPQGEFMPQLYYRLLTWFGFKDIADQLQKSFSYVVGEETSQSHFATDTPAILFCFESVDPKGR